jgi:hypothetical protein
MMGSPFTGIGFAGYDNHTKKFVSTWMDSMGTAVLFFEGTARANGKTITQESRYDDPIKGPMKWRSVTKIVDDNTVVFEMYGTDRRGKKEKMMELPTPEGPESDEGGRPLCRRSTRTVLR